MKNIVCSIIARATDEQDFDLAQIAKSLIDKLAVTCNAPSNWRDIGNEIAEEYKDNAWVYEAMSLWEYED